MMVKQSYTVRFMTPVFLGDAEQNGAWRTPPFKALLRQWWRVAAAKRYDYDYEQLREAEGRLFGSARPDGNSQKSKINIRLGEWRQGKMQRWNETEKKLNHPEVTIQVDANLYLGYGPLIYDRTTKKPALKANAAIQADEHAELCLAYPKDLASLFSDIVQLIHWFGTLGGRSRNGWGSLDFSNDDIGLKPLDANNPLMLKICLPLGQCLRRDWPHAVSQDEQGFSVWISKKSHDNWREAMLELAKTKIQFRTHLAFFKDKGKLEQRHLLAYPVTNHPVDKWEKYKVDWSQGTRNARLANQLRFKVTKNEQGKYFGLVYHLPCGIPGELLNALSAADQSWIVGEQLGVWQSVHTVLDQHMQRI